MILNILQVTEQTSKKSGEVKKVLFGLGEFQTYGQIEPATVKVNLTDAQYLFYKKFVGKEAEVPVIVPKPDFPLNIAPEQFTALVNAK